MIWTLPGVVLFLGGLKTHSTVIMLWLIMLNCACTVEPFLKVCNYHCKKSMISMWLSAANAPLPIRLLKLYIWHT